MARLESSGCTCTFFVVSFKQAKESRAWDTSGRVFLRNRGERKTALFLAAGCGGLRFRAENKLEPASQVQESRAKALLTL